MRTNPAILGDFNAGPLTKAERADMARDVAERQRTKGKVLAWREALRGRLTLLGEPATIQGDNANPLIMGGAGANHCLALEVAPGVLDRWANDTATHEAYPGYRLAKV
jgi:hypothetical protein